jgi:hypothetical protein
MKAREVTMKRLRIGLVCTVTLLCGGLLPVVLAANGAAAATGDPSITSCPGTTSGLTFTLTANCDTTARLTVANGMTVNGAGHTITAHDPPGGNFSGAVLTNAGSTMNIENLTIQGTGFATDCASLILTGIFFDNAAGSVSGVTVKDITQHSGCQLGLGIRANATDGVPRTVTITNTVVSGYQKGGLVASGAMTMNVSASTIGPPDNLPPMTNAQNGVQYGGVASRAGAGGTISGSTIYGSGFGSPSDDATAVLLYAAKNVTLTQDIITGAGTDVGVAVAADTVVTRYIPVDIHEGGVASGTATTGTTISHNQIGRTVPDSPDTSGIGVRVDPGSSASVTCNSFSGWKTDIVGAPPQPVCITSTTLPFGTVHVPYSATLAAVGGTPPYTWSLASGSLPPGLNISPTGMITGTPTVSGTFSFTIKVTDSVGGVATQAFTVTAAVGVQGYWLGAADGGVFTFGSAAFHGSAGNVRLNAPIVGIANTPAGGYWMVASDGGVFSFGAPFLGSLGGVPLRAPIVGIAATPEGGGYYLVGADGSVFPFGDAIFRGSMEGKPLNKPVVGIGVTPDNGGYYLVASDGGVFTFGDAAFHGSMGGKPLNKPVVGMAVDNTTFGYWLVAADGGVFTFAAPFLGSTGNIHLNAPVVGMAAGADDLGYRLTASDGGVFCFGTAQFLGSMGGKPLNKPVVGIASIGP